ncbi:hypothetical protein [Prescottella agglutinans]|uniref:hypothetical protein n=1 Tax=Prescottella agglutinans TaxID=1644129 RepID=UPI003D9999FE
MAYTVLSFDVVERGEVSTSEIERLALDMWQALSAGRADASPRPRWVDSGPVDGADAYVAHRFVGTIDTDS